MTGHELQAILGSTGLTTDELARICDVDVSTVNRWLNCKRRRIPHLRRVVRILKEMSETYQPQVVGQTLKDALEFDDGGYALWVLLRMKYDP